MKKILEVFGEPISHGGQEAFIFNVLRNIDMEGLQIDFFTPYYCDNPSAEKLIREKGGDLFTSDVPFAPGKSRRNIVKPLRKILEQHAYDGIHIHSGSISVLALDAQTAASCHVPKIIVHSHCSGYSRNAKYRLTKAVMTPLLDRYPTNYLACSEEAGRWKFSEKVCKEKLQIVKNGIELSTFMYHPEIRQDYREKLGIGKATFLLINVGRFSFQKNQVFAVKVLRQVKKVIPDTRLLLIGSGELETEIKDSIHQCDLEKDVIFTGNVSNVCTPYSVRRLWREVLAQYILEIVREIFAYGRNCIGLDPAGSNTKLLHIASNCSLCYIVTKLFKFFCCRYIPVFT